MNLFPPWSAAINPPWYKEKVSLGYHFLASPPLSPFGYQSYIVINYSRLIVQWVLFFLLMVAAHYTVGPLLRMRGSKK